MKLVFLSACAAVLLSQFVRATPFPNTSREFYLRTIVFDGPKSFANLYRNSIYPLAGRRCLIVPAGSYHTGAGLSVPVLGSVKNESVKSYFNGTYLNADLGTDFPWGWTPAYFTYAAWLDVGIDAGQGVEGFKIDKGGNVAFRDNRWIGECGSDFFVFV
jgi:hypothetical protein